MRILLVVLAVASTVSCSDPVGLPLEDTSPEAQDILGNWEFEAEFSVLDYKNLEEERSCTISGAAISVGGPLTPDEYTSRYPYSAAGWFRSGTIACTGDYLPPFEMPLAETRVTAWRGMLGAGFGFVVAAPERRIRVDASAIYCSEPGDCLVSANEIRGQIYAYDHPLSQQGTPGDGWFSALRRQTP